MYLNCVGALLSCCQSAVDMCVYECVQVNLTASVIATNASNVILYVYSEVTKAYELQYDVHWEYERETL